MQLQAELKLLFIIAFVFGFRYTALNDIPSNGVATMLIMFKAADSDKRANSTVREISLESSEISVGGMKSTNE